jgi:hypothetical protein
MEVGKRLEGRSILIITSLEDCFLLHQRGMLTMSTLNRLGGS